MDERDIVERAEAWLATHRSALDAYAADLISTLKSDLTRAREELAEARKVIEDIAGDTFTGPPGISIYAAAANELTRVKARASVFLAPRALTGADNDQG